MACGLWLNFGISFSHISAIPYYRRFQSYLLHYAYSASTAILDLAILLCNISYSKSYFMQQEDWYVIFIKNVLFCFWVVLSFQNLNLNGLFMLLMH